MNNKRQNRREDKDDGLIEKTIDINRVAKVVKGGRRFNFTALVVVGDGNGRVGLGYGKAAEVPEAIRKAGERARRNMVDVPVLDGTVPHFVKGRFGASKIVLRPASPGTGVIAGAKVGAILDAAGYSNVSPGRPFQQRQQRRQGDDGCARDRSLGMRRLGGKPMSSWTGTPSVLRSGVPATLAQQTPRMMTCKSLKSP